MCFRGKSLKIDLPFDVYLDYPDNYKIFPFGKNKALCEKDIHMVLSDALFQRFSSLVYQECGINLHEGKKALLQARLNKRMRATGFLSYDEYFEYITSRSNAEELVHFLDCISTNLTYFFREPQHFELLDKLVPELLEQRKTERSNRIRIWSAGCSTGEEPYSLAMRVLGHLDGSQKYDFRILATDISTRALGLAVNGVYAEEKVQKVPDAYRKQYFRKINGKGDRMEYEVVPALKSIITFRRLNLKESFPFKGPFDYVFCRNVMIYFDKKTQEALIQKISNYLDPAGYLFVGHSESLMGLSHPLSYVRPAVYRK